MKAIFKIIILCFFLFISYRISAQTLLFSDNFSNFSKISSYYNIIETNNTIILSNLSPNSNGYIISKIITKATNQTWANLNIQDLITNYGGIPFTTPSITLIISDTNNSPLYQNLDNTANGFNVNLTNMLVISSLNNIKIKLILNYGQGTGPTPYLQSYSIFVNQYVHHHHINH